MFLPMGRRTDRGKVALYKVLEARVVVVGNYSMESAVGKRKIDNGSGRRKMTNDLIHDLGRNTVHDGAQHLIHSKRGNFQKIFRCSTTEEKGTGRLPLKYIPAYELQVRQRGSEPHCLHWA